MSFSQVKSSLTMKEKLREVRSATSVNRREIAKQDWRQLQERTTRTVLSLYLAGVTWPSKLAGLFMLQDVPQSK